MHQNFQLFKILFFVLLFLLSACVPTEEVPETTESDTVNQLESDEISNHLTDDWNESGPAEEELEEGNTSDGEQNGDSGSGTDEAADEETLIEEVLTDSNNDITEISEDVENTDTLADTPEESSDSTIIDVVETIPENETEPQPTVPEEIIDEEIVTSDPVEETPVTDTETVVENEEVAPAEPEPEPKVFISLSGRVINTDGLAGVTISAADQITVSDDNGFYNISSIEITDLDDLSISFSKSGYADNQKIIPVSSARLSYGVNATLNPFHFVGWLDADSTDTESISIADPIDPFNKSLVNVEFPSGSIPNSGQIKVSVMRGDPTSESGKAIFPGDFTATQTKGGAIDTFIESVAFTEITLNDLDGNEITTLNSPASVTLKLPDALQSDYVAGDTIPWWSYDEDNAVWLREDAEPDTPEIDDALIVEVDGLLYAKAKVTHFSWWNVDKPITEHGCLCTEVENEDSNPVSWVNVSANGVTYNARSANRATDNNGVACVTVKRSANSDDREKVEMRAEFGGKQFKYNVDDPEEGETGSPVVKTPTEEGSMILDNPGVCLVLKNKIRIAFDGLIQGSVTDDAGNPMTHFEFHSDMGEVIKTDNNGDYGYKVPTGTPVTFFKSGLFTESTTAMDASTPQDLDIVLPNVNPWIQKFNRSIKGNLSNNTKIDFSVLAVDPEGQALTYSWSADGGYTLSIDQDNSKASFTTPETESGAVLITLVVTDVKGAASQATQVVSWGDSIGTSQNLNLVFMNNANENRAVSGVVVSLHDASGAISNTVSSDASGIAYIGNTGATTATFSILYTEADFDCKTTFTDYMQTFVNVPVGNIVYYLDNFIKAAPRSERTSTCSYSNVATYDAELSNVDTVNPVGVKIYPKGSYVYPLSGTGSETFSSVSLTSANLNSEGKFDILAYAYAGSGEIFGYDYLVDQSIDQGSNYTFNLDMTRTASQIPWARTNSISGPVLTFTANRKGIVHTFNRTQSYSGSGNFNMLADYPADSYAIEFSKTTKPGYYGYQSYRSPPSSIDVPEPEMGISAGQFNTDTFSWVNSNTADINWISMNLSCGVRGLTWNVWLNGETTSWDMIEVPTEVASCATAIRDKIGGYNGENIPNHYIAVYRYDIDTVSDEIDLWTLLAKGKSLEEESSKHTYSVYRLNGSGDAP